MDMPMLIVILIVVAVLAVAIRMMLAGRGKASPHPACGACGYDVRGVTTWACPECGADLRDVGIITPGTQRPAGPWMLVVTWTMLVLVVGGLLSSLALEFVLPMERVQGNRLRYRGSNVNHPVRELFVDYRGSEWVWPMSQRSRKWPPVTEIDLSVMPKPSPQNPAAATPLDGRVDPKTMTLAYRDDGQAVSEPVSTQALLDWMASAGVDVSDPVAQTTAKELRAMLAVIVANPGSVTSRLMTTFSSTGSSPGRGGGPNAAIAGGLFAFWAIIWIAGAVMIIRGNASLRRTK